MSKLVQILFLFFLAMMASGLNLTSIDLANLPYEDNVDDNRGCEKQTCKTTSLFYCTSK